MYRIKVPRKHPLAWIFRLCLRDALFQFDEDDFLEVSEVLKGLGTTFDRKWRDDPAWILKRVRRVIPQPEVLVSRLNEVMTIFRDRKDESGVDLLDAKAKKAFKNLLVHAGRGCLSDLPGIQYYYPLAKKDKHGLTLWRCIRGTSSVEGAVHQKIRSQIRSWNAGPVLADLLLMLIRHCHNMRAAIRNIPGFKDVGHYDIGLVEEKNRATLHLYGSRMEGWLPVIDPSTGRGESFGIVPPVAPDPEFLKARDEARVSEANGTSAKQKPRMDAASYIARKQQQTIAYLGISTPREMKIFKAAERHYLMDSGGNPTADLDSERMADDWNRGRLKLSPPTGWILSDPLTADSCRPNGVDVFRKTALSLQTYWKEVAADARKRERALEAIKGRSFSRLERQLRSSLGKSEVFPDVDARNVFGENAKFDYSDSDDSESSGGSDAGDRTSEFDVVPFRMRRLTCH